MHECLPVCLYVYHVYTWYLWRSEEGFRVPGTRVTVGCELKYGHREPNPSPR